MPITAAAAVTAYLRIGSDWRSPDCSNPNARNTACSYQYSATEMLLTYTAPITATSGAADWNIVSAAVVTAMTRESFRSSRAGLPAGVWPAGTATLLT